MVIFHCYVSSPEGSFTMFHLSLITLTMTNYGKKSGMIYFSDHSGISARVRFLWELAARCCLTFTLLANTVQLVALEALRASTLGTPYDNRQRRLSHVCHRKLQCLIGKPSTFMNKFLHGYVRIPEGTLCINGQTFAAYRDMSHIWRAVIMCHPLVSGMSISLNIFIGFGLNVSQRWLPWPNWGIGSLRFCCGAGGRATHHLSFALWGGRRAEHYGGMGVVTGWDMSTVPYLSITIYVYLCLSISIYVYVCLSLSMSIYVYLCLSMSISIYVYLCLSMSMSVYLYLCLSMSIYVYLCLSLSMSIYVYLCLSISIYVYLSLSISIYVYVYLSLSMSFYVYLSLSMSIYVYLSLSMSMSIYLYLCLSMFIYLYLCLSMSIYLYLFLSMSIYLYLSLSMSIYLYLCLSVSIYVFLSLSMSIYIYLCLPMSFYLYLFLSMSIYIYLCLCMSIYV